MSEAFSFRFQLLQTQQDFEENIICSSLLLPRKLEFDWKSFLKTQKIRLFCDAEVFRIHHTRFLNSRNVKNFISNSGCGLRKVNCCFRSRFARRYPSAYVARFRCSSSDSLCHSPVSSLQLNLLLIALFSSCCSSMCRFFFQSAVAKTDTLLIAPLF